MHNLRKAQFLIEQELTLFPLASLSDIYKLFFQNCRGSRHFMQDLSFVKDYINKELHQIDLKGFHYPEYDISYLFKIKRVSLLSILIGKYDTNYIADRFLELAVKAQMMTNLEWGKEWTDIKKLTLKVAPGIRDDLSHKVIDMNSSLHHSDLYRKSYNPHYRICNL